MAYHKTLIRKGEIGEISKIREEFEELVDAHCQDCKIMEMIELSDLIGAIECYAQTLGITLNDLIKMKDITKSAFLDGTRKSR